MTFDSSMSNENNFVKQVTEFVKQTDNKQVINDKKIHEGLLKT